MSIERRIEALQLRLRLQMLITIGGMAALLMAFGGADVVARALVEADAWKIMTKNAAGSQTLDRLVVTTDVDRARVRVLNANIELEPLASDPSGLPEGSLSYNSTSKKLKYFDGTAWVESGGGGGAPGVRVHNTAAQSLSATLAALNFNSERYDTNGMHDNATNNTRITFQTAGKYHVWGNVEFSSLSGSTYRELRIRKNGSTYIGAVKAPSASSNTSIFTVSVIDDFAAGDYVELMAATASLPVSTVVSASYSPEFGAQKVD